MKKEIITPIYQVHFPVNVAKSNIAGRGAFALQRIPERKKIGDPGV